MAGSDKSVLHDATPSWNGYNYQGKVGLYVCLVNILREVQSGIGEESFKTFLDEHHIEYEWIEDFAIKKNDRYLSLHQVKHKSGNNFNDHVEAIATILYRKNKVLSDTDIYKYFEFTGLKPGNSARIKAILKNRMVSNKLVDDNWLLNSDWKAIVQSISDKYRDNITKCFIDFELLSQKAFSSSITYFHTAKKVNPPLVDISKVNGIPRHLVSGLIHPKSLSCQNIFLSFDSPSEYDLALSDDDLNTKLIQIISDLLIKFNPGETFLEKDINLYKTALCALIDQNVVKRHQHIRDKCDKGTPYLKRTKPSVSFRDIVSELMRNLRVQDKRYWNLVCRENFETAYTEQLQELYENIKFSNSNEVCEENKQFISRLESVRINIINNYFPDNCIVFLRQIYPHKTQGPNIREFYEAISEPQKIKSVFLDFIQEVVEEPEKLTLCSKDKIFEFQPSCIDFNFSRERRKQIEIDTVRKGLVDNHGNQSLIHNNVDYIVVNSTGSQDVIPAGIEKITEVESYDRPRPEVKESDKYTKKKEVSFMDSRKALGEING